MSITVAAETATPRADDQLTAWLPLVAEILGLPEAEVPAAVATESFVALGGTSLQAIGLVSAGQCRLGRDADIAAVLSARPLAEALRGAGVFVESAPLPADPTRGPSHRALLPGQKAMLAAHVLEQDQPYHLMFTLDPDGPLDLARTREALGALAARHESLRTLFTQGANGVDRVVLPAPHQPRLLLQTLPAADVRTVHDLYGRESGKLLRPFEQPPVVFALTSAGDRSLLTVLVHHVLVDGWSIGVLWRDFVELYQGAGAGNAPAPDWIGSRLAAGAASGALAAAMSRVTARLDGAPTSLDLPTDLPPLTEADGRGARLMFELSAEATEATETLARRGRVTVTTVLMAAWALAVSRRAGVSDLVLGMPASGRFEAGMDRIVGLCTRVVPVRCRTDDNLPVGAYLRATGAAVADAVADSDLPFEQVVAELGLTGDAGRNPLAQLGFAAHHELVPDSLTAQGKPWRVHEGHCHGSVFDALLYLQSWGPRPRLALEYATSVLAATDAGELAESLRAVLIDLARDPDAPLGTVTGLSACQSRHLRALGVGGSFDTSDDLWSAFERHAETTPDAPAVTDNRRTLTYREMHQQALAQAAALHAAGVGPGDRVLLEVDRSAAEAVAVLAILRLGAAYVAVDRSATAQWREHLAAAATPRARIGGASAHWPGIPECALATAAGAPVPNPRHTTTPDLPAIIPDPSRAAYVSFTSGSTGVPKGVVVSHRAVLRLAADPDLFADGAGTRMLRLAPLAFDASTLELLVPLAKGDSVSVYPAGDPTPLDLTEFLRTEPVTHAWLTSGFFHLVADHRPDAFRGLRQLFTGGGVVSPVHVRKVLEHCPGLRVTNGYGPTENTTFTSTFHVDSAAGVPDPLPIGRPVHGTEIHVVDPSGRLAPRGAIGELQAAGEGLADGYLDDPGRTAAAFGAHPGLGRRVYRTGDLVRWGADGTLRFLGRNDRQVKIAGHRIELVDVESRIKAQPGVLDAVVFLAGERLCAAVKAAPDADPLPAARPAVEAELAAYARPQRWFTVDEFPLDRNGKVDLRALAAHTSTPDPVAPPPARTASLAEVEDLVAAAWAEALGTDDFDFDEVFFEVGGDSLSLAVARKLIQKRLGGAPIPMTDMYRFPTVQALAAQLHARQAEGAS
ncbi:amino acid adenylation domain-containing protein [Actinokineospora alba]|uniref:Amino acid adenylation domain-containing protein n=1 Tax=Actinokineospora alba TaxID=504798 RepID=A0A1H0FB88_9PSEU|nr:non-ribosomal peptide synthetase [Actinokineospora alba]TDP69414.1 amino acid adenylation domain-containing protein [Actinokineospora alba]SDI17267.1 amino acid adenylation domain-containing protein [Actinokineospora alba]SDN91958.1 amino acid adenylation domain-containing protein [Actinokineospora alba]